MSDLIDRQAAIDTFKKELCREREYAISFKGCELILNEIPSAEKTGKWIDSIDDGWFCSNCGSSISSRYGKYSYCPECGARMVVSDD